MAGIKGKSGGRRDGAGRATFKPTDAQRKTVEQLSACGIRIDEMPVFIVTEKGVPISAPTLKKYFRKEIQYGRLKANYKVANALYKNATEENNITAQIFWLKTQAGWKEAQRVEHSGIDGAPIATKVIHAQELTDDQLAAIVQGK